MLKTTMTRAVIALGAATALALAAPLAASAHVRVSPNTADPGGYAVLTFRVPTESATAGTVKLEVDLPTGTPFGSVSYQPVPGWSATVVTETLPKPVKTATATITEAPTKVVWTADAGNQIAPGQFQQFTISAGPVPDTGSVMLPARQTYSDGTVVNWDEKTPSSGAEPEHPAPTLYITDPPPAGGASGSAATLTATPGAKAGTTGASGTASASADSAATDTGIGLGIAGLALGAIALVVAVFAVSRRRTPHVADAGRTEPREEA
jgi:uncharacterized protein YcnI